MENEINQLRESLFVSYPQLAVHVLPKLDELEQRESVQANPSPNSPTYVYTIQLQDGYFYVGSSRDPIARFDTHKRGEGSAWTREHSPEKMIRIKKVNGDRGQARIDEDAEVKRLAREYGLGKVRGGSYSKVNLTFSEMMVFERELWHAEDACLGCGSTSHWVRDCDKLQAKTRTAHSTQPDNETVYRDQGTGRPIFPLSSCGKCGRCDHKETDCTAMTDIHGVNIATRSQSNSPVKRRSIHDGFIELQTRAKKRTQQLIDLTSPNPALVIDLSE